MHRGLAPESESCFMRVLIIHESVWALNTLFSLNIEFTFWTAVAAWVLVIEANASGQVAKRG